VLAAAEAAAAAAWPLSSLSSSLLLFPLRPGWVLSCCVPSASSGVGAVAFLSSRSMIQPSSSIFTLPPPRPLARSLFHLSCHASAARAVVEMERNTRTLQLKLETPCSTCDGNGNGIKWEVRWGAPEHKRARDFPDPVGDSSSAFSPLSAALSTLLITPYGDRSVDKRRRRRLSAEYGRWGERDV